MDGNDRHPVGYAVEAGVVTITMDDAARRNALGAPMRAGLMNAFARAASEQARAVILRAAPGSSVWCAGFDINDLGPGVDPLARSGPLQALFHAVQDCACPVIAQLNGSAWGGGADLALRCDIAVGTAGSTIAFTPAKLGLPYDTEGLLNVLLRGGMSLAIEMFATGDPLSAQRALAAGMLNHVVPAEEQDEFTQALARRIANNAPLSVASAKAQLRALNAALPLPPALLHRLAEARAEALSSADFAEGLAAFKGKRKPVFQGR